MLKAEYIVYGWIWSTFIWINTESKSLIMKSGPVPGQINQYIAMSC